MGTLVWQEWAKSVAFVDLLFAQVSLFGVCVFFLFTNFLTILSEAISFAVTNEIAQHYFGRSKRVDRSSEKIEFTDVLVLHNAILWQMWVYIILCLVFRYHAARLLSKAVKVESPMTGKTLRDSQDKIKLWFLVTISTLALYIYYFGTRQSESFLIPTLLQVAAFVIVAAFNLELDSVRPIAQKPDMTTPTPINEMEDTANNNKLSNSSLSNNANNNTTSGSNNSLKERETLVGELPLSHVPSLLSSLLSWLDWSEVKGETESTWKEWAKTVGYVDYVFSGIVLVASAVMFLYTGSIAIVAHYGELLLAKEQERRWYLFWKKSSLPINYAEEVQQTIGGLWIWWLTSCTFFIISGIRCHAAWKLIQATYQFENNPDKKDSDAAVAAIRKATVWKRVAMAALVIDFAISAYTKPFIIPTIVQMLALGIVWGYTSDLKGIADKY